tara:strand:+ start:475 stop:660 length:186 start_codon:yes stop_codon:yes gene_type:complete
MKDNKYWDIHKEVYMDELDKLDPEIAKIVQTKPLSQEAKLFTDKVEAAITVRLKENSKFAS